MFSPKQILDVLKACSGDKPKFPSQIEVSEMNLFSPIDQQQKQSLFTELHTRGLLQIVRDPSKRTPRGWSVTDAGRAEISLLQRHPALTGKAVPDPTAGNVGSF